MPHATLPSPGFQALILCGPGVSLDIFTSNPEEFPKALVPIANRPMVWYPLDWCYRMGITNILLITPPESAKPLEEALDRNPYLTSLPAPKPDVIAPKDLSQNTGTAEAFRLPEIQAAIKEDFIILPCDLICELDGSSLLESWMVQQGGLGGATGGIDEDGPIRMGIGGERSGRRGGLSVWYETKGVEGSIKGEETDFVITTPLPAPIVPSSANSLRSDISKLVYSAPTDTLKDIMEEKQSFPIRYGLLKKHGRIKMRTTYRDAHVYFFPYWVKEMMARNVKFDSVSEDVLGWWAKAGWQDGLADKLHLRDILQPSKTDSDDSMNGPQYLAEEVDIAELSSTSVNRPTDSPDEKPVSDFFASRVSNAPTDSVPSPLPVPPILAYIQPVQPSMPLIRRVDTMHQLLTINLRLAKLTSIIDSQKDHVDPSPFAHPLKISDTVSIPRQCTVTATDSLVDANVTVAERCNIKESVIGAGCTIGSGARLLRCLLMDGVTVGENVVLSGSILGRRCKIEGGARSKKGDGEETVLKDCQVQEGFVVPWGTEGRNEKFTVFEGLSEDGDMDAGMDDFEAGADDTNDLAAGVEGVKIS